MMKQLVLEHVGCWHSLGCAIAVFNVYGKCICSSAGVVII